MTQCPAWRGVSLQFTPHRSPARSVTSGMTPLTRPGRPDRAQHRRGPPPRRRRRPVASPSRGVPGLRLEHRLRSPAPPASRLPGGSVLTFLHDEATRTAFALKLLRDGSRNPTFGTGAVAAIPAIGRVMRVGQAVPLGDGRLLIADPIRERADVLATAARPHASAGERGARPELWRQRRRRVGPRDPVRGHADGRRGRRLDRRARPGHAVARPPPASVRSSARPRSARPILPSTAVRRCPSPHRRPQPGATRWPPAGWASSASQASRPRSRCSGDSARENGTLDLFGRYAMTGDTAAGSPDATFGANGTVTFNRIVENVVATLDGGGLLEGGKVLPHHRRAPDRRRHARERDNARHPVRRWQRGAPRARRVGQANAFRARWCAATTARSWPSAARASTRRRGSAAAAAPRFSPPPRSH